MTSVKTHCLESVSSQEGDSTADDWDDTELLKEYDRAVRPLKALVAERMGLSNAEVEEASATESCGSSRSAAIENHAPKSHKRNNRKRHRKAKHKQQREVILSILIFRFFLWMFVNVLQTSAYILESNFMSFGSLGKRFLFGVCSGLEVLYFLSFFCCFFLS